MSGVEELQRKLDSQSRRISSLEDRGRVEQEWASVQRLLGLGVTLVIVALFLPWRHEVDRGPDDFNSLLRFGAAAAVVAVIIALGVFVSNEPRDTAGFILVTALVALGLLAVGLASAAGDDRHAPIGPGVILSILGCAVILCAGAMAWSIDRRPKRS